MASLESQASELGIPMEIVIDDSTRYPECDAHAATLASIEGTKAIYRGQCANRHVYRMEYEIHELQQQVEVIDGEYVVGQGKGHKLDDLEEY